MEKVSPRLQVIVSIFFIGYGIVDILSVNVFLGIALLLIGVWMNISAYKKRIAARKEKK